MNVYWNTSFPVLLSKQNNGIIQLSKSAGAVYFLYQIWMLVINKSGNGDFTQSKYVTGNSGRQQEDGLNDILGNQWCEKILNWAEGWNAIQ